jgi:probable F420-dependent oxidoreductase
MSDQVRFSFKLNIYGHPPETPFDVFVHLAQHAEAVGFHAVYVVDHMYLPPSRYAGYTWTDPNRPYFLEAWTILAALAQATHRVMLGPQVSPITFRHPSMLAKMGMTVDRISNGRLVLQLGTGWHKEEHEAFGFPFDERFGPRLEMLQEAAEIIDGLWTADGPYSFEGKHFTLREAPFWPKPVQRPRPPIWFGGMGQKVRPLIGKYGAGWAPAMAHMEGIGVALKAYTDALDEIRGYAVSNGRDPDSIVPALAYTTSIHEDRDRAGEAAAVMRRRSDWADLSLEEMRDRAILMWGNPDDCLRAIEPYVKAGVREFTLNFVPFADMEAAIRGMELYAAKVLPRLG